MPQVVPEPDSVASMDAQASKLDSGYSSDADADPEIGDVDALPTQMGMEISFKVRGLCPPTQPWCELQRLPAHTRARDITRIRCLQHARIPMWPVVVCSTHTRDRLMPSRAAVIA